MKHPTCHSYFLGINKWDIPCYYSADTRTMNAKALFSLYLYFFITYFITFFRTSQSQTRGDVTAETFFRPFSTEKRVKRCVGQ